jgi:hypothetical protein
MSSDLDPLPAKPSHLLRELSGDRDPPVGNSEDLCAYSKRFRRLHEHKLMLKKNERAAEVADMINSFSRNTRKALFTRRCNTAVGNRRGKLRATAIDQAELRESAAAARRKLESSSHERWDAMKRRHADELARHDGDRPTPELTAQFRKRSADLLQLMRTQRGLDLQSRFDESRMVGAQIERTERSESEAQFRTAVEVWEAKRRQLQEKHQREEAAMREWIEERQKEYDRDRENQIEAMDKRKKMLDGEIRDIKGFSRCSDQHAVRRHCKFDRAQSRGVILTTTESEEIDRLYESLTERARQELLRL